MVLNKPAPQPAKNTADSDDDDLAGDDESRPLRLQIGMLMNQCQLMVKELNALTEKIEHSTSVLIDIEREIEETEYKMGWGNQFIWRVTEFRDKLQKSVTGEQPCHYSEPFFTHYDGYQLALCLFPSGDAAGQGEYVSLYFCVLKSPKDRLQTWPFQCRLTFTLLDLNPNEEIREHVVKTVKPTPSKQTAAYFARPTATRNKSIGIPKFIKLADLFDNDKFYIVNDSLFIQVEVDLSEVTAL